MSVCVYMHKNSSVCKCVKKNLKPCQIIYCKRLCSSRNIY